MPLRPYQIEALENIRTAVAGGVKRLVVQAATGAGKTKIAAAMVENALRKGKHCAFVVPAISLIDQTVESFWAEGITEVGVIQSQHMLTDWSKPVQVCSIQTLERRGFPDVNAVIIDECHRLHQGHKKWLTDPEWGGVPMIGLSATPWTRGLGKYFDSLLVAATTKDLIDQGFLSKFKVFATGHPDLVGIKTVAGDYHEGQLAEAMQRGSLVADIIGTWQKHWGKDKTLVFAVDCTHAKSIQERFEQSGITCGYQDARTTDIERKEIRRKFHAGELRVVVNVETLTTGVDWDVRCLVLARPTRSEMLYVQIIGRALRTAPGKDYALILDHSDTTSRLGFVTDIHHDELSKGQPITPCDRKPPLPKECSKCAVLKPPGTRVCPNCGHEPAKPINELYEEDGELIEIDPDEGFGPLSNRFKSANLQKIWTEQERRIFYRELRGAAELHNHSAKWPVAKYKSRFGTWPPFSWNDLRPLAPSSSTLLFIKRENIKWHMSKGR